jgi:hypothetical protein
MNDSKSPYTPRTYEEARSNAQARLKSLSALRDAYSNLAIPQEMRGEFLAVIDQKVEQASWINAPEHQPRADGHHPPVPPRKYSARDLPMPSGERRRISIADRTPEQRGLARCFFDWMDDPTSAWSRSKFLDRFVEADLKAQLKAAGVRV